MVIALLLCLVALVAVLLAVYRDEPLEAPGPARPPWELLPSPDDVSRSEFPLAVPGYDPASVEVHVDALARAYCDLYAAATPEVLRRARERARLRRAGVPAPLGAPPEPVASTLADVEGDPDTEALRQEAALAALRRAVEAQAPRPERVLDPT